MNTLNRQIAEEPLPRPAFATEPFQLCSQSAPSAAPEAPDHKAVWEGSDGKAIMIFGVLIPSLVIAMVIATHVEELWHMFLRYPVETLMLLSAVWTIPLGNFTTWNSICTRDLRYPIRRGLTTGFTVGASGLATVLAFAVCNVPETHSDATIFSGMMSLTTFCFATNATSIYLLHRLRASKETRRARSLSLAYGAIGIALSILTLAVSNARATLIRYGEYLLGADSNVRQEQGLAILRNASEFELRMECGDPHSAGLIGLFFTPTNGEDKRAYFAATGKPFISARESGVTSMSDERLKNEVVGETIEQLTMVRSLLSGNVHPSTLSATIDWTFVIKNKTLTEQEARAEIQLPPGAVVSDFVVWQNGEPKHAVIGSTDRAGNDGSDGTVLYATNPSFVTDLGRGRILARCASIAPQCELKAQLTVVTPLKPENGKEADLTLPRLIATNFGIKNANALSLNAESDLKTNLKNLHLVKTPHGTLLNGSLSKDVLIGSPLTLFSAWQSDSKGLAFINKDNKGKQYVVKTIAQVKTLIPEHVVVVIDQSAPMSKYKEEIASSLKTIPSSIDTKVILANDSDEPESVPVKEALAALNGDSFAGGHDDLPALVKAAQEAGENPHSAVLWIHGPQPCLNEEMYIVSPFMQKPSFYELSLDSGTACGAEILKNHKEIGPFVALTQTGNVSDDLKRFLQKWNKGATEYQVAWSISDSLPDSVRLVENKHHDDELAAIFANRVAVDCLQRGWNERAAYIAGKHHIVTSVTSAAVTLNEPPTTVPANTRMLQGATNGTIEPNVSDATTISAANITDQIAVATPMLQSATGGTVGPQVQDMTYISGVNTADTVRVNNLANLEALINIFANGAEILGIIFGASQLVLAAMKKTSKLWGCRTVAQRVATGIAAIGVGLITPEMVDWLLWSARDANLFS